MTDLGPSLIQGVLLERDSSGKLWSVRSSHPLEVTGKPARGRVVPLDVADRHARLWGRGDISEPFIHRGVPLDYGLPWLMHDGRPCPRVTYNGIPADRWVKKHGWRRFMCCYATGEGACNLARVGWSIVGEGLMQIEVQRLSCYEPWPPEMAAYWYFNGHLRVEWDEPECPSAGGDGWLPPGALTKPVIMNLGATAMTLQTEFFVVATTTGVA